MRKPLLAGNIWKYTAFLVTNKRVWAALMAVYYLTIPGVNEIGVSYVLLAANVVGVLLEIPSGYWADVIGHRKALILSRIFAIISSGFFLISWNIWSLILGSIFLSAANAFTSGTGNALMQETLKALDKEHEYAHVMGKVKSLGFSIPLILSAFVPFFAGISLRVPFLIGLLMDILGLYFAISLVSPPKNETIEVKELGLRNLFSVISESIKIGFMKYAIYTGVLGGLIFAIGNYRGPYQESVGASVIYFGLFFALGRLFASVLLWFSGKIQKKFTMEQFFFGQAVVYMLIFWILGTSNNTWLVVLLFAIQNGVKWGLTEIEDSYFIGLLRGSRFKATILSIGAQVQQIIGGAAGLLVGWIIFNFGYKQGFLLFALVFTLIMATMYFVTFIVSRSNINTQRGKSLLTT
jgi:MFS family permease